MTKNGVLYLAGPMTGYPQFNLPLFDKIASELRALGYTIVSPAELDEESVKAAALRSEDGKIIDGHVAGQTWGDFLSRDVKIVADHCTGIVLLPHWYESKGARLECFTAIQCGHNLYKLPLVNGKAGALQELSHLSALKLMIANRRLQEMQETTRGPDVKYGF